MRTSPLLRTLAVTAVALLALVALAVGMPGVRAAGTATVSGSLTGPNVLAVGAHASYTVTASGGPAFASNGTQVGNLSYYLSLQAANLTGVSLAPESGALFQPYTGQTTLTVGAAPETVTILMEVSSVYRGDNVSANFTYTVNVVTPYVVSATIVATSSSTVLSFPVRIALDGTAVGTVTVPTLTPGQKYNLSYQYPTLGLSSGWHTFTISLASEHGLVSFANGATEYSSSFYVSGPAPNYTLWYVTGTVAFVGVLFIFVTRVAARRRGPSRK